MDFCVSIRSSIVNSQEILAAPIIVEIPFLDWLPKVGRAVKKRRKDSMPQENRKGKMQTTCGYGLEGGRRVPIESLDPDHCIAGGFSLSFVVLLHAIAAPTHAPTSRLSISQKLRKKKVEMRLQESGVCKEAILTSAYTKLLVAHPYLRSVEMAQTRDREEEFKEPGDRRHPACGGPLARSLSSTLAPWRCN